MSENVKKQKISFIVLLMIIAVVVFMISTSIFAMVKSSPIKVDIKKCTVEYGEQVNPNLEYYLTNAQSEVLNNSKFTFDVPDEEGKNYPSIGTYTALVEYNKHMYSFEVEVKDTIKPQFINFPNKVEISRGSSYEQLADEFEAQDLSKVKISVSKNEIDLNTVGEYKVTIKATDEGGNFVKRMCNVKVVEGQQGLYNSGYEFKDGKMIYFEEYYSYAQAKAARQMKIDNGFSNVSKVHKKKYNGEVVYRIEWEESQNNEVGKDDTDDDGDDSENDTPAVDNSTDSNNQVITPDYQQPSVPNQPVTPSQPTIPNQPVTPTPGGDGGTTPPVDGGNNGTGGNTGGGNEGTGGNNGNNGGGEVTPPPIDGSTPDNGTGESEESIIPSPEIGE